MKSFLVGTAPLRAVSWIVAVALLCVSAGCASYSREPIDAEEFRAVLERRTADSAEVAEAIGPQGYNAADGLTLEEAELLALHLNPGLRAARLDAGVAQATARFAGLWSDPELGADALHVLEDVDEPWLSSVSLSFSIPISGRLALAKSQAKAEARAALVAAWREEQSVLLALRQSWADWQAAMRSLEASRVLHESLRQLVGITNQREDHGVLIAAEAVAFRLAEARMGLEVSELRAAEEDERLRIHELVGLLPTAAVQFDHSGGVKPPLRTEAVEEVLSRSPDVLLAAARHEAAEESLRLEVRKQFPDINIGPAYGNEDGMGRFGLGFSIPIPILNANRQGIAEARARRDVARAEWELAVQSALSGMARLDARTAAATERHRVLRTIVVPLANEQIGQARALADLGEVNTLLILESLQSERDATLDLIEAEASIARLAAERAYALPSQIPTFDAETEHDE